MAKHNELGKRGEQIAKTFLLEKGYQILESNWRYRKAELDLIAMDGNTLVFVEVKTRSRVLFGTPELAVTTQKEQLMVKAALAYMRSINHDWSIRFDIIAIVVKDRNSCEIQQIEGAFFPA